LKLDVDVEGDDPLIVALKEEERGRARELDGSEVIKEVPEADSAAAGTEETAGGEGAGGEGTAAKARILARSSPYSELQTGQFDISPDRNPLGSLMATLGKSYVMAVAVDGRFKSLYAGMPVPSADGEEAGIDSTAEASKIAESPETQIIVLGTSFFIQDNFLSQFPENAVFFQNAVDDLTLGPELIGIRSRGATDRPLKELSDGGKTAVRTLVTLGPAVLVILMGVVRRIVRRQRRASIESALRSAAQRA
jgi:hypothetical protein